MHLWMRIERVTSKKLVGIIGSGLMGRDPFDRRSWSTLSYFFFSALQRRDALHRAFGVEAGRFQRYGYIARNIHPDRETWRCRFYNDTGYRDALTAEVARRLQPDDFDHSFLQIGAMYDLPRLSAGRALCYSYHDGNLAETLRSPYAPKGLGRRNVDRALRFERSVYQGMTRVFAMGEYLRRSFIDDFGVPPDRVRAIGAGINLDAIPEPVEDKRYDSLEVLFIGVDFPRKGGWELLSAFKAVREKLPRAVLHIVGPKSLSIPPALDGGVIVHGYLSKNDPLGRARLDDLFRRSCLFVMPSLYEPFGVAPLEAMAHQLPCLVTDGWALRELVAPGETGDLVECGSVDDLQRKLVALLSDPDRLRRMGAAGRLSVLEHYTWDRVVDRLLDGIGSATSREAPC